MATQLVEERREADLFGTWLARIGSVGVMIGAAFGFKYAVDLGVIGPTGRVAIGLAVAVALVGWGEYSRARTWPRLAQSLVAGGLVVASLSVWAASQLYELITAEAAFGAMAALTALTVFQALRYDALALGVLAAIGGYAAPAISGTTEAAMTMGYALILTAGLLGVAFAKRWTPLQYLTLAGVTVLFTEGATDAEPQHALIFATMLFAVYVAAPLARAWSTGEDSTFEELPVTALATFGYFAAAMWLAPDARALWSAGIGVAALALSGVSRALGDRARQTTYLSLGVILLVVAVPLYFEGPWLVTLWGAQGAALAVLGFRDRTGVMVPSGLSLMAGSLTVWFAELPEVGYRPERLIISPESFAFISLIAAMAVAAFAMRSERRPEWERLLSPVLTGTANVLALGWLSAEAVSAVVRAGLPVVEQERAIAFALSLTWSLYAAGLLGIGVVRRIRIARIAGLSLFGLVLTKLVMYDVWALSTAYRFVVFSGLGVLLLVMSVLYHRLRELLARDEE